jgi:hypothetical protein
MSLSRSLHMNFEAIVVIHDQVLRLMEKYDQLSLAEVAAIEDVILAYEVMPEIPLEERWRDGKFIIYVDPTKRSNARQLDFYQQLIHIKVKEDIRSGDSKILP